MEDLGLLVFIALTGIAIGFALGMLFSGLRNEQKPGEASESKHPAYQQEIARLWRDRRNGSLIVEAYSKQLRSSLDLTNPQLDEMMKAAQDWRTWMGAPPGVPLEAPRGATVGMPSNPQSALQNAVSPAGLNFSAPTLLEQAADPLSAPGDSPVQGMPPYASNLPPASTANTTSSVKPVSLNPINIISRAVQADVKTPAAAPKSIVMQIDEILQAMLVSSPLRNRGIRLVDAPGKGLLVMIGLQQYEGIDAVPEAEIRDLIRKAVSEWEKRS